MPWFSIIPDGQRISSRSGRIESTSVVQIRRIVLQRSEPLVGKVLREGRISIRFTESHRPSLSLLLLPLKLPQSLPSGMNNLKKTRFLNLKSFHFIKEQNMHPCLQYSVIIVPKLLTNECVLTLILIIFIIIISPVEDVTQDRVNIIVNI